MQRNGELKCEFNCLNSEKLIIEYLRAKEWWNYWKFPRTWPAWNCVRIKRDKIIKYFGCTWGAFKNELTVAN